MAADTTTPESLTQRKIEHIEICRDQDVESKERTTLLEEVHLHHDSLPELAVDEIDLSTTIVGRRLPSPLMISGMTGGADQAAEINRSLARLAQRQGLAMGLGSQRAMLRNPALLDTYSVRSEAPNVFLLGNIGGVQAAAMSTQELDDLVGAVDANALCIHLNPAQEIVQDQGDRDFRGVLNGIARAAENLSVPLIIKETGAGMGRSTLERIRERGVKAVDVSGSGGTTWVGVEAIRGNDRQRALGELLWDWGVPTAVSIGWARETGLETIASGGLRSGLDMARALAMGANLASSALPWLRAVTLEGDDAADELALRLKDTIRAVMLLTGSPNIEALHRAPRTLGPTLRSWLDSGRTT